MNVNITKILLHLKAATKRRSTWVVIISITIFIATVLSTRIPDVSNTKVAIVLNDSQVAKDIIDSISEIDEFSESVTSIFEYVTVEDEDELKEGVINGTYECGFVFSENFDRAFMMSSEDTPKASFGKGLPLKRLIEYVYSPYTTKGMVAKESLYAQILKEYSKVVLSEDCEKIFGTFDNDVSAHLLNANEEYLNSSEIFTIEFRE